MKIVSTKEKNSIIKLDVKLDEKDWDKYKNKALRKVASTIKMDGFRKGHVPESVVRQNVSEGALMQEAADLALSDSYMKALIEEKINPIAQPDISVTKLDPLEFTAEVQVYPEVKVGKVDGGKFKPKAVKVTKKEIEETMETFTKQFAEEKPVDRKSKKGDSAIIDFDGKNDKGESQSGMQSQGHPLELGSNTFIPGFEGEVIGMKKGEEKTFPITFPKNYHAAEYAGKEFHFTVTVQEVMEKKLPKLDDELVKKITGEDKTVAQLEEQVKGHLAENKEKENYEKAQKELFDEIGKHTTAEVPPIFIEEEIEGMIDNMKMQGLQMGMPWDKHLEHLGKTEEEIKEEMKKDAEKAVLSRVGVQQLIQDQKIEISDEAIEAEIAMEINRIPEKDRAAKAHDFEKNHDGWYRIKNRLQIRSFFETHLK